jgi:hypothetical protein
MANTTMTTRTMETGMDTPSNKSNLCLSGCVIGGPEDLLVEVLVESVVVVVVVVVVVESVVVVVVVIPGREFLKSESRRH